MGADLESRIAIRRRRRGASATWLALAAVALAACGPSSRKGDGSNTSVGAPAGGPQASAPDLNDCQPPSGLLHRFATLRVSAVRPMPFDSAGLTNGDFRLACHVEAAGHFADSTRSEFDSLLSWLHQADWREARYQADGPDGSSTGRHRNGVTCIVSGMWDGGDDTDTTYVPSDTLTIWATCAKTRAVDTLPPE